MEDYTVGQHAVFKLQYHFVFVTKYRKPVLQGEVAEFVKDTCIRLIKQSFEGNVLEIETDRDHIHILTELGTKYSIKQVANCLKGVSSRLVRKQYNDLLKSTLSGASFWSESYFVSSVGGAPLEVLKKYIQAQPMQKRKQGRPRKQKT